MLTLWRYIATLPETKEAGIKLEVKNLTDYVSMNAAVANHEIDVNAFQSYAYMVAFNDNNKDKIAPLYHVLRARWGSTQAK